MWVMKAVITMVLMMATTVNKGGHDYGDHGDDGCLVVFGSAQ